MGRELVPCHLCDHESSTVRPMATVLGPVDLCLGCYGRYQRFVQRLATFYNRERRLPTDHELLE